MITRAKPLLGTVVTIEVDSPAEDLTASAAIEQAFAVMVQIGSVMSAHDPDSDLGLMSRATPGEVLGLNAHTVTVLRAAQYWSKLSCGAFNPVKAAQELARKGVRPGLQATSFPDASLADVEIISATQVRMRKPLQIDLGGIAKGYAVDQSIQVLAAQELPNAIVNAGGDIRVLGSKGYLVGIRHAGKYLRDHNFQKIRRLQQGALATSVAEHEDSDFVRTIAGRRRSWRNATVMAADCMTADVLTKWALQSSLLCPGLNTVLRQHQAKMWRN